VQFVEKLRKVFAQTLGQLNVAARLAIIIVACVVVGGLILWLSNELVISMLPAPMPKSLRTPTT
jgi:hypothetical protein